MEKSSFSSKIDLKQTLITIMIAVVIFLLGFWTAKRIYEKKDNHSNKKTEISQVSSSQNMVAKEVDGVFWIKAGESAVCPETHKIKAKFNQGVGFFYTPENKSYNRVKPEFCLATEEYAKNAGFLKK